MIRKYDDMFWGPVIFAVCLAVAPGTVGFIIAIVIYIMIHLPTDPPDDRRRADTGPASGVGTGPARHGAHPIRSERKRGVRSQKCLTRQVFAPWKVHHLL